MEGRLAVMNLDFSEHVTIKELEGWNYPPLDTFACRDTNHLKLGTQFITRAFYMQEEMYPTY